MTSFRFLVSEETSKTRKEMKSIILQLNFNSVLGKILKKIWSPGLRLLDSRITFDKTVKEHVKGIDLKSIFV